jgi:hypothetical protein
VFWVRRALALAVLVVVVILAVVVVRAVLPGSSSAATPGAATTDRPAAVGAATPTSSVTASASGGQTPSPAPSGVVGNCAAGDVQAQAVPSSSMYLPDEKIRFAVTIRNVGSAPCVVDGSDKARAVLVTSHGKTVWSSATCASGQRMLLLAPGDVDTRTVAWDRRSATAHCGAKGKAAPVGDYEVTAQVLGDAGGAATFTLAPKPVPSPPAPTATPSSTATPTSTSTSDGGSTASPKPTAKATQKAQKAGSDR